MKNPFQSMLRAGLAAGLLCGTVMLAPMAAAHHSFSAYDRSESAKRTIRGTVRDFALINPHGWLKLVVPQGGGQTALWSFEMSSATQLQPLGWAPDSIRPGDKVDVTYFPLRFGSYGGQLVAVRLPGGRVLAGTAVPDLGYPKPATGIHP